MTALPKSPIKFLILALLFLLTTRAYAQSIPTPAKAVSSGIANLLALESLPGLLEGALNSKKNEKVSIYKASNENNISDLDLPLIGSGDYRIEYGITYGTSKQSTGAYGGEGVDNEYLVSSGLTIRKDLDDHFYTKTSGGLIFAKTTNYVNYGTDPNQSTYKQIFDGKYLNTSIYTGSATFLKMFGYGNNIDPVKNWSYYIECSAAPLLTQSLITDDASQQFTSFSTSAEGKIGVQYISNYAVYDRPISFAGQISRAQFFGGVYPLSSRYLNKYTIEILRFKEFDQKKIDGLGVVVSYLNNGVFKGITLGARLKF
jgi:hypothetical protein